ncbi:MAG TPA: DNA-processing protein DprA [Ignavibacteriaceae bacterium]|nr:DNA-processing protein DprA [Ignavibacteriaceae bacterium]
MTKTNFQRLIDLKLLLSVEGIGPVKIRSLLTKLHSLEAVLSADFHTLIKIEGINSTLAKKIIRVKDNRNSMEEQLHKEIEKLVKLGGRIITIWDKEFPTLLKKIYDPPLLLYVKGSFNENDNYSISIVGTRQPSNYGKIQAERFASESAGQNITIVSGLARGIDTTAHSAAIKASGRTFAILGCGLDVIYPPENRKIFNEIANSGMVISEYELGTKPDAPNFPRRNRIISGISLGTIVIETAATGGAMQTASFALDQNREVFAIPGNLGIKQSEGTNLLIQKGEAKLVREPDDIIYELEYKLKPVLGIKTEKPMPELTIFEEKITACLSSEPTHIDKISQLTSLSISDCLVHLLTLEFKGVIKQLPGKMFALM